MSNKDLQLINDEIISYKQSIQDIENKINLLKFLNGVDNSLGKTLNLDGEELLKKRKDLERKLRKLLEEKSRLVEGKEPKTVDNPLEISAKTLNSLYIGNYLSFLYSLSDDIDTPGKKENNNI